VGIARLPAEAGVWVHHQGLSMQRHVIIVGAGPGGLASALLLAKEGIRVTVVEKQPRVGGRTSSFQADGFRFDLGPTFFHYPRVLEEIFAAVGRDLRKEVNLLPVDPLYRLVFGAGGELRATSDLDRMEKQVAALSPADAPSLRRWMDDNRRKLASFKPCLESPFLSLLDLFHPQILKLLPLLKPWRSLDGDLKRYFSDPRVRLAFSFQSKYLGMSPFQCPSLFSILSFLEYEYGIFHPEGGCGEISHALARVASDLGVDIRLSCPVRRILFSGKTAVGVETDQGEIRGDAIVINADFARAMTRLVPDRLRRRWTDRRISGKRFSCSTFMLYLGIDGRFDEVPHHNVYISADYERNLREIEKEHVLSEDPSCYLQNATITDRSLAPDGMSTLYILVPVTHRHPNVDWRVEVPRQRALALRQVEKLGIRDVEKRIRYERILTPPEWEEDYEIYRGATFNLAHNLGQLLHKRPRNRFEDLDAVYLVGGGTHPGSGLPVIFESARITAKLLLEDLPPAPLGRVPATQERARELATA